MRIKMQFELIKNQVPLDYRSSIMSFIKHTLSSVKDGKYFEMFYKDTMAKDFTWCVMFHHPSFLKDIITLSDSQITMLFSVRNADTKGLILVNAFLNQKGKTFALPLQNSMTLKSVQLLPEKSITGKSAIFKTAPGSSMCVRQHDKESNQDTYYTPADDDFDSFFLQTLKYQLIRAGFSQQKAENVRACFVHYKKLVVKHYHTYMDTVIGSFAMEADADVLQYFLDSGIGSRRSEGFGFINLQLAEGE